MRTLVRYAFATLALAWLARESLAQPNLPLDLGTGPTPPTEPGEPPSPNPRNTMQPKKSAIVPHEHGATEPTEKDQRPVDK